ncbi:MAG: hypothetical protein KHX56_06845 [Clostridiales bacterium]|nr:hypothetical protein [Clostridiales bacterium]
MSQIKRGVSLYSYQQEQFFKRMNIRDMVKEVHDQLKTDGIEIICDAMVKSYPNAPDDFYNEWNELMAEFQMKAVTMDIYMDVLQFRDHVMDHREVADRLIRDLYIAKRMGFENVRCLCTVPIDSIEMALPVAEELGVRIGKEIHAPFNLRSDIPMYGMLKNPYMVEEIVELADRKHTKYVGLVPDMGIFQTTLNRPKLDYMIRTGSDPKVLGLVLEAIHKGIKNPEIAREYICSKMPDVSEQALKDANCVAMFSTVEPKEMEAIVPYIVSIHGKFYQMTEIPGCPGQYEDLAVNYKDPIHYLKAGGFDGYICSEYEGQRDQQDRGMEYLADEVLEVRRHHEMLARLVEMA